MTPQTNQPWRAMPVGLSAPESMESQLREAHRAHYILAHGFTADQLGPDWWRGHDIEITFPTPDHGSDKLTRSDLFEMGSQIATDDRLLSFIWHVLAWGSGTSRRHNTRRIDSCRKHVKTLRSAVEAAQGGDPRSAYSELIRPGRATVPGLGPAFFTKILYFASEGAGTRCLILDARVARSLYDLGWAMSPTYAAGTSRFSYNWYTDTYVNYCSLLEKWAHHVGADVTADMFERALFAR